MSEPSGGQQETYSLREWLQELSHGLGLRDPNIETKLGGGLRRLLNVEGKEPGEITDDAIIFFDELLSKLGKQSYQLAGRVTLNTPGWPELDGKVLEARREWLGTHGESKPYMSPNTARDQATKKVFPYLEKVILTRWHQKFPDEPFPLEVKPNSWKEPTEAQPDGVIKPSEAKETPKPDPFYISRERLHAEFETFVNSATKVIVLHGLPGMGKTWLARALTMTGREKAPFIRFDSGQVSIYDLDAALRQRDIIPSVSRQTVEDKLIDLLCGTQAPQFVVLDNFTSSSQLYDVLPANMTATVVATCRVVDYAPEEYGFVSVGEMEDAEAEQAIRSRVPSISNEDSRLLATTLSNYPLAIRFACGLIRKYAVPVKELRRELLSENPQHFIEGMSVIPQGDTLYTIIERLISEIEQQDECAHLLLETLPFFIYMPMRPLSLLERYLQVRYESQASPSRFYRALDTLHDCSLVEVVTYGDNTHVDVHPILNSVLYELFQHSAAFVAIGFLACWRSFSSSGQSDYAALLKDWRLSANIAFSNGVVLLAGTFIDNYPPGAADVLEAEQRDTFEIMLASAIIYFQKTWAPLITPEMRQIFDRHDQRLRLPEHWLEWAHSRVQDDSDQSV